MKTRAHIDGSLVYAASRLLSGRTGRFSLMDLGNLLAFSHALVLFDEVVMPISPEQKLSAAAGLPHDIVRENVVVSEPLADFDHRRKEAIKQAVALTGLSRGEDPDVGSSELLLAFFEKKAKEQGPIWMRHFLDHLKTYKNDDSPYMTETSARLCGYLDDAKYKTLTFEDHVAIAYVWRCFLHTNLALDNNQPYLHNDYRTPFVNAVYQYYDDNVIAPLLMDVRPPIKSLFMGFSPMWEGIVPSLLGKALSLSDSPKELRRRLLDMRHSAAARDFRSFYAEVQDRLGEPKATGVMERELKNLATLWSGVSKGDPVRLPVEIRIPGCDLAFQIQLPDSVVKRFERAHARLGKRHFRFMVDLIRTPRYSDELYRNAARVFGPLSLD